MSLYNYNKLKSQQILKHTEYAANVYVCAAVSKFGKLVNIICVAFCDN